MTVTKTLDLDAVAVFLGHYNQLLNAEFQKLSIFSVEESDAGVEISRQMRIIYDMASVIEGAKTRTVQLEQWALPEAQEALNNNLAKRVEGLQSRPPLSMESAKSQLDKIDKLNKQFTKNGIIYVCNKCQKEFNVSHDDHKMKLLIHVNEGC